MRDRLIELLEKHVLLKYFLGRMQVEKLADYLLVNGVIVPPCKVGDTVYYICFGKIYKGKCHAITRHENSLQIHLYDYDGDNASFASDNVFPTRNEAENALAKKVFDLICED